MKFELMKYSRAENILLSHVIFYVSSVFKTSLCKERRICLVTNTEKNSSLQADSCSDGTENLTIFRTQNLLPRPHKY